MNASTTAAPSGRIDGSCRASPTKAQFVNKRARIIPFIKSIIPPVVSAYVGPTLIFLQTIDRHPAYTRDNRSLRIVPIASLDTAKGRCLPQRIADRLLHTVTTRDASPRIVMRACVAASATVVPFCNTLDHTLVELPSGSPTTVRASGERRHRRGEIHPACRRA